MNYSQAEMLDVQKNLNGWCSPQKAARLYNLVLETDSKISVEVGVFGGASFIPIAFAHARKNSGYVQGIDSWDSKDSVSDENAAAHNTWWVNVNLDEVYAQFVKAISESKLNEFCRWSKIKSVDMAHLFKDDSIDIFHQDSSHNKTTIITELQSWIPKLKMNAIWIADDCAWSEAKEGYSHLSDFGLQKIEDFTDWQVWQKVKSELPDTQFEDDRI